MHLYSQRKIKNLRGFAGNRLPPSARHLPPPAREGPLDVKLLCGIADRKGMKHHRRKTKRNLCAALLLIRWSEDGGRLSTQICNLEDISATGACLHLEHFIPAETAVSLHHAKGEYKGKVKYCRSQEIGYLLGIAFDPGYRWNRFDFQPAHLVGSRASQAKAVL